MKCQKSFSFGPLSRDLCFPHRYSICFFSVIYICRDEHVVAFHAWVMRRKNRRRKMLKIIYLMTSELHTTSSLSFGFHQWQTENIATHSLIAGGCSEHRERKVAWQAVNWEISAVVVDAAAAGDDGISSHSGRLCFVTFRRSCCGQ